MISFALTAFMLLGNVPQAFAVQTTGLYTYPTSDYYNSPTGGVTLTSSQTPTMYGGAYLSDSVNGDYSYGNYSASTGTSNNPQYDPLREMKAGVFLYGSVYENPDTHISYPAAEYMGIDGNGVPRLPNIEIRFSNNVTDTTKGCLANNIPLISLWKVNSDGTETQWTHGVNVGTNPTLIQALFVSPGQKLESNTSYKIKVAPGIKSKNGGITTYAYEIWFRTKGPDPAWTPEATFQADPESIGPNSLTLKWTVPADDADVSSLAIYRDDSVDDNPTSFPVGNLTPDTEYTFALKALHADGSEAGSLSTTARTGEAAEQDEVLPWWENGVLQVSNINTTSLQLSWSGAQDNKAVTGYKVLENGNVLTKALDGSTTTYTVRNLNAGTSYHPAHSR